jgi:hypothetical protein
MGRKSIVCILCLTWFPGASLHSADSPDDPLPEHALLRFGTPRKDLTPNAPPKDVVVRHATFSPDGRYVAASGKGEVICWDARTGKEKTRLAVPARVSQVAFSPDSTRLLAVVSMEKSPVWDVESGRLLYQLKSEAPVDLRNGQFTPDGKLLVTGGYCANIRLWNAENGDLVSELGTGTNGTHGIAIMRDGSLMATGGIPGKICLWDLSTRKLRGEMAETGQAMHLVFSPSGGSLASSPLSKKSIQLWELASGKLQRDFKTTSLPHVALLAPDGMRLVTAESDHCIRVYDLATSRELIAFRGHRGDIHSLAFDARGERLVSGSIDGTVIVWDATAAEVATRKEPLADSELQEQWRAFLGDNAKRAYDARWKLLATPEQAMPLVEKQLKELPKSDARQIARWVADLDAEEFKAREAASLALEEAAEAALPSLRKLLDETKSPEARRRAAEVIEAIASKRRAAEAAGGRMLELLESIGDRAARMLLEQVAKDENKTGQAQQARLALERLKKRDGR